MAKKRARKKPAPKAKASPKSKPAKPAAKPTAKTRKTATASAKAPARKAAKPTPRASKPRAKKAMPAAAGLARPQGRAHVHDAGEVAAEVPPGRPRVVSGPTHAGVGDAAVRRATGKGWEEWLTILDEAGGMAMEHKAIAQVLRETHDLSDWWSQMVTVGYEQARGKREKHEAASGFQASMSKTIGAPIGRLFRAWADEGERSKWLDAAVEVRVANEDKNIRLTWREAGPEEGTSVEVGFFAREGNRGMVQVQQNKLADQEAVARVKAFWSVKLEALRAAMERAGS